MLTVPGAQAYGALEVPADGVLHVIVGHGLPQLYLNTLRSFRTVLPEAPLLVVDNASPQAGLRQELVCIALNQANTELVLRSQNELDNAKTGGLYSAYRLAFERARTARARLVHLMQADMQLLWWGPEAMAEAERIYDQYPGCVNIVSMALSRDRWLSGDVVRDETTGRQVLSNYGLTDTGLFHLGRFASSGTTFGPSESDHARRALQQGLRAVLLGCPTEVQVPWPAVVRNGRQRGRELANRRPLLCQPLDEKRRAQLKLMDGPLTLEDICVPWGWSCLSPMWNTDLDNVHYWAMRRKDIADNGWRAGRPRWVTSGLEGRARALTAPHRPSLLALVARPVLAYLRPERAGPWRYAARLAGRARERWASTSTRTSPSTSAGRATVVVTPRADNPYQQLLYREVERQGVAVRYAEGPTGSQTLNVALAPVMLVLYRLGGARLLHLHWVYQFSLPWAKGALWSRRLMQHWFALYTRLATGLGYKLVWTAHNILPHEAVFADDSRALDDLLARADLVIALSEPSRLELLRRGARRVVRVPAGPYASPALARPGREAARAWLGHEPGDCVVVHVGKILPYKGLDRLLEAVAQLPDDTPLRAVVVGSCPLPAYADRLRHLAALAGHRAVLRLERVDDDELSRYLSGADAAVFPFQSVTNSSSVLMAQCFGLPVVIPDLPMLGEVPAASALRYDGSTTGLRDALAALCAMAPEDRHRMGAAGYVAATAYSWGEAGLMTATAYRSLLGAGCAGHESQSDQSQTGLPAT